MRLLILAALAVNGAFAQSVSIDLVKVAHTIKARHDRVPATVRWRRITAGLAGAATMADYATTYRGFARVPNGCEQNHFLQGADGCSVNTRRFTLLKVGMLAWLSVGEEVAHKLPHGDIWDRENIILNSAAAVGFTALAIHNEAQK